MHVCTRILLLPLSTLQNGKHFYLQTMDHSTYFDKNAICQHHTPQHTSFTFNAMMFSAIILKEHINESDKKILSKYFTKAYKRFVKPLALGSLKDDGFYEWGDGGIGVLAYAHWTNDKNLAYKEIKRRRNSMIKKITKGAISIIIVLEETEVVVSHWVRIVCWLCHMQIIWCDLLGHI